MRGRRTVDVMARSPPLKTRDRRSNEGGLDGYPPLLDYARQEREQRLLRNLSPPELERPRRILVRNRRSSSLEGRDYTRHGGRDYPLDTRNRMPPFGLSQDRAQFDEGIPRRDSPSVEYRQDTRNRMPPFGLSQDRAQFDERIPRRNSPSVEHRQKYRMMESTGLSADLNITLKYAGVCESREKDFQGASSSFHDERDAFLKKTVHLDDRAAQTFFTLPPDSCGGNYMSSSGNCNVVYHKDKDFRYEDSKTLDQIPARKSYNEEEKPMLYYDDVYYPRIPMSQSKAFESTSSGLTKGNALLPYGNSLPLPTEGFDSGNGKYVDSLRVDGFGRTHAFDAAREPKDLTSSQRGILNSSRGEHWDYNYHEIGRREKEGHGYPSDELYRMPLLGTGGEFANRDPSRPSYIDMDVERFDDLKRSHKEMTKSDLWDRDPLQEKPVPSYFDIKKTSLAIEKDVDFVSVGPKYLEFGARVTGHDEITHLEGSYGFGREAGPGSRKEILNSSPIPKSNLNMYRLDASPKQRLTPDERDSYYPSERMLKRKYILEEDLESHNSKRAILNSRDISRRVQDLSGSDEQRTGKLGGLLLSKGPKFGRFQYMKPGRLHERMGSNRDLVAQDLSFKFQGNDVEPHISGVKDVSIKMRLKPASMNMYNIHHLDRRQDFRKPYKVWRRSLDDHYDVMKVQNESTSGDWVAPGKSDPLEDSDEFKQLVHRAFLRFSKQLNENPAHRRRYKEEGKAGTLLCSVCGSFSKEFADTHSLVAHAFMSQRVGLKIDHLGLHKALCVLMGWSSDVSPGGKWNQQFLSNSEALALKEDLILWPPLVIIHNISIENKNPDGRQIVTIEEMAAILRDMGFNGGTTKVCRGKPANQSIMVVKFMPTFSGLQEAEKLHKYYIDCKRGRKALHGIISKDSEEMGGAQGDKLELVLYGYLGIAEDLEKLDFGTKKRCMVKSKKDIQAIADAPLKDDEGPSMSTAS